MGRIVVGWTWKQALVFIVVLGLIMGPLIGPIVLEKL